MDRVFPSEGKSAGSIPVAVAKNLLAFNNPFSYNPQLAEQRESQRLSQALVTKEKYVP
jgi:hypothetical protein